MLYEILLYIYYLYIDERGDEELFFVYTTRKVELKTFVLP